MLKKAIVSTVDHCARYATQVIGIAALLGFLSAIYTAGHYAIDADVGKLISQELPWRKRETAFDKLFPPKEEAILAVIDAPTSELASQAAAALIQKLADRRDLFLSINEAGGGPFFQKNGLLFLPTQDVAQLTKKLGEAKPLIQALAQDFEPAWPDHRAELRADRRAHEALRARRSLRDLQHGGRHARRCRAGSPGELFLACHAQRQTARRRRATTLHRDQAGAQLFVADTGEGGNRRHSSDGDRPQAQRRVRCQPAAHRAGADLG